MSLEAESSRFVQANGMQIHYHDLGQGEPLILIHGGGPGASGWSNYSRNAEELAKHFRVIVIDLPGYGKSDKKASPASVFEFMSDTVLAFMDALKIDKASFVGNSLGGGTSLKFCIRFPDRTNRLILMGAAGGLPVFSGFSEGGKHLFNYYQGTGPSLEKLRAFLNYLVYDPRQVSDELLKLRFEASNDPEIVANPPLRGLARRHPEDELWRERLSDLPHKTLLIWGREDGTVTLDSAFIYLRTLPNAQLHVFPQCGHWAQWERADEFNELVTNFLNRK
jgi:2-hydroxy-6-oxonona-2,4-dienedioate hydrolase/4,5:9,10-diseco-3-hydroxy-5,9,17-trioxoandrosta-1(10),2-diene-4-oate hydrolase